MKSLPLARASLLFPASRGGELDRNMPLILFSDLPASFSVRESVLRFPPSRVEEAQGGRLGERKESGFGNEQYKTPFLSPPPPLFFSFSDTVSYTQPGRDMALTLHPYPPSLSSPPRQMVIWWTVILSSHHSRYFCCHRILAVRICTLSLGSHCRTSLSLSGN